MLREESFIYFAEGFVFGDESFMLSSKVEAILVSIYLGVCFRGGGMGLYEKMISLRSILFMSDRVKFCTVNKNPITAALL